jgi:hypothetical protein
MHRLRARFDAVTGRELPAARNGDNLCALAFVILFHSRRHLVFHVIPTSLISLMKLSHSSLTQGEDRDVPIVVWGSSVRHLSNDESVETTKIAPTIAAQRPFTGDWTTYPCSLLCDSFITSSPTTIWRLGT